MALSTLQKTTLNEKEAAAYIGMSRSWLRQSRCLQFRYAPPYIKIGYQIRYRIEDLKLWKRQNRNRKAPYWKTKQKARNKS